MVAFPLLRVGGRALAQLDADEPGAIFCFAAPAYFSREEELARTTVDVHPEVDVAACGDVAIRAELQAPYRYVVRDTGDGNAYECRAIRGRYDLREKPIAALRAHVSTSVAYDAS